MAHHVNEPHGDSHNARLNSLRAGVLGANDGIVSVAALLLGVVGSGRRQAPSSPPAWPQPYREPRRWRWENTSRCQRSVTPNG